MGLNVLGPLELIVDGNSVEIGAPRTRIVLAAMARNANRTTSVDQLVDAVWGSSPPETARGQIQVCVSALRRVFTQSRAPISIRSRAPGYVLEINEADLDVVTFDTLVDAAQALTAEGLLTEAATSFRAAIGLWRGPALAGLRSDALDRWAAALNERRITAVESAMAIELSLGHHDGLIGELREQVAEHPLRERMSVYLALALYRAGRQAEALGVCRKARSVLAEELGIDPGEELQAMERAILTQDPSITVASPAMPSPTLTRQRDRPSMIPRQLPARVADFVGREAEAAAVARFLTVDARTRPGVPLVAISGPGGVGKSSLAIHLGHEFAAEFPDGQLYADLRGASVPDVTARLLAAFLRGLGVDGSAIPDDPDERAAMFRSRLAGRRILVILDDVSDEVQVEQLLPGDCACAVIATSRHRLRGLAGAFHVELEALELDRSVELLRTIVGRDRVEFEPDAVMSLSRLCEGLPLALRIAGARLASRPHWLVGELVAKMSDEVRRLDELAYHDLDIRSAVATTYRSLDDSVRRLFRMLSLVRVADFPRWVAAALLDTGLNLVEELLEELVDVRLLTVVQDGWSDDPRLGRRYRLHDLVRAYAAEQSSSTETAAERDQALRRLLGGWVALAEDVHGAAYGDDDARLRSRAARWRLPDAPMPPAEGDPYAVLDVDRRALVAAVRVAAAAGWDDLCWDLAYLAKGLFLRKGYYDDWRETTTLALATAERAGNRVGRAVMLYSLGELHVHQQRFEVATPVLIEAVDVFRSEKLSGGVGHAVGMLALVHRAHGDADAMTEALAEATAAFQAAGDREGEAGAVEVLARYELERGDLAAARGLLSGALRILDQVKPSRKHSQILHRFAELYDRSGEVELAKRTRQDVLHQVRQLGDAIGEVHALHGLGMTLRLAGEITPAREAISESLDLAVLRGARLVEARARLALGEMATDAGQADEAVWELQQAEQLFADLGAVRYQTQALLAAAAAQLELGRDELAADYLHRAQVLRPELDPDAVNEFDEKARKLQSALAQR